MNQSLKREHINSTIIDYPETANLNVLWCMYVPGVRIQFNYFIHLKNKLFLDGGLNFLYAKVSLMMAKQFGNKFI